MFNRRKSFNMVETFLMLIFIMIVCGIFYFISSFLIINILMYNVMVFLIILLTIIVVAIAIFQFIKMKYTEAVKVEVKVELDNYKLKFDTKILESNTRIGYFEVEYSKKLKKIMKDYSLKVKELEDIKRELAEKVIIIDKKNAELELEISLIRELK